MFTKESSFKHPKSFLIIGWTLVLVLVMIWNWQQVEDSIQEEALVALRMAVDNDLTFRLWATEHGGIYVPITPQTQPNPYLSHIENRDVNTLSGEHLTLLNPAYIMRQVYEKRLEDFNVYNRLISLNPTNPINVADTWEAKALKAFKSDRKLGELSDVSDLNEQSSIRLIKPFYIEEGCLRCHEYQGYKVGDLRGAISAAAPLGPYAALIHSRRLFLSAGYALIWIMGVVGIGLLMSRLESSARRIKENELRNRAMVEAIPDMLFHYNQEGVYLDAEVKGCSSVAQHLRKKIRDNGLIGQRIIEIMPIEYAKKLMAAIEKVVLTGEMQLIEYDLLIGKEPVYFEERLVLSGDDEVMSIVRDVTEQKKSEARLEYLSFHDGLTGVYNRNYFENELKRLSESKKHPICIISIDINGLKLINDALGHVAGDRLLTAAAMILRQSIREKDLVARVGGDEFVIILPKTDKPNGQRIVERIRLRIKKHNNEFPYLPLSLSLGLTVTDKKNKSLIDTYKQADDLMYREKLEKGIAVKDDMIKSLVSSLNKKNYNNTSHKRLSELCSLMGKKINLPTEQLTRLTLLSEAKDLGKVCIADEILHKREADLTEEEKMIIKEHPTRGYRIALSSTVFAKVADLILKHQERWDGSGFPLGLRGEEIPLECRILAIADAFVDMTSKKPNKDAFGVNEAIQKIESGSGSAFDPKLVTIFLSDMNALLDV